jgi:Holliday junction resolvasome RuvABC endonuclease subunit
MLVDDKNKYSQTLKVKIRKVRTKMNYLDLGAIKNKTDTVTKKLEEIVKELDEILAEFEAKGVKDEPTI